MYTSFYKLNLKPFQISSDPDFMWLGEKHKEALATLKYGVLDNKGFLLLTGDVGTGKTTLINSLIQSLGDDIIFSSVPDPSLSRLDFFNYIAASFGIHQEFSSKGAFLGRFRTFLLDAHEKKKKVLLIIDEAQLLTQELLEEIRLLSNIEKTNTKLINIFFVGQNEFNEILNQEKNRAVRQRLTLNYNIDPLTPDETGEYIKYRLKISGAVQPIFEPSAVQEVFMYSGGFPRRINVICDHALLSGYVKDSETINANIVHECAKELKIPAYVRNRDINGFADYSPKPMPSTQSQSIVLKPKKAEKKKKGAGNILAGIIAFFFFLVICWWILFPVGFQKFIVDANGQLNFLKTTITGFFPESLTSSGIHHTFDPGENKREQLEKSVDPSENRQQIETTNEITPFEKEHQEINKLLQEIESSPNSSESVQEELPPPHVPEPLVESELEEMTENTELSGKPIGSATDSSVPDEAVDEIKKKILSLPTEKILIRFKYNSNDFSDEGFYKLKEFAEVIIMHPDAKVMITGYTDSDGSQNYNIKLSEFRANIVRSFLMGKGAASNQIEIKGMGSQNPVESNDTIWGRMMNRRVEIEILK